MPGFGRYGDSDHREREREREFDRDRVFRRDEDRDDERSRRRGMFGGDRDDRDDRDDRGRDRGFFGDTSSFAADRRSRDGRDRDRDRLGDREEGRFGSDDSHRGLPIDETNRLIASNKVEGTSVYGREGERLGTIYNFMVDKYSGQVEYAVMRYGGFLGMGQRYYPLPWRILSYDTKEGGYRINLTDRDMERAPSFGRDEEPRFSRDYGRRVNNWYGLDK
jgi:sporulation protein YlmC with PRC-barrel domain